MLAKKTIIEMPNLVARVLQTSLEILPTYNIQEEEQGSLVLLSYFLWLKKDAISYIDHIHLDIVSKLIRSFRDYTYLKLKAFSVS